MAPVATIKAKSRIDLNFDIFMVFDLTLHLSIKISSGFLCRGISTKKGDKMANHAASSVRGGMFALRREIGCSVILLQGCWQNYFRDQAVVAGVITQAAHKRIDQYTQQPSVVVIE